MINNKDFRTATKQEDKIKKFIQENEEIINDLNIAYIESRYLPVQFSKEQIDRMFNFVENLLKILE